MTRQRLLLAAVLVAVVATFVACGGDDDPVLVSTSEDSAAPTEAAAEPTATPAPAPEEPTATPAPMPTPEPAAIPQIGSLAAADFTEVYGCGFGFWASNADQTAAIFIEFTDVEAATAGQVPPVGAVPSVIWSGRVEIGTDLFANWCDDVLEPGEPTPDTIETWQIVDAGIAIDGIPPVQSVGVLTAMLTAITVESSTGEQVVIGDLTLINTTWGAFAG